jgi:hypothetical protein
LRLVLKATVQAISQSHRLPITDTVYQFKITLLESQPSAKPEGKWDDYDPEESNVFEPKVIDGKRVPVRQLPETKWVVEVIGGGGKVQAVLGEFWTYGDASACSLAWSLANPDDLRLTREREVKVAHNK